MSHSVSRSIVGEFSEVSLSDKRLGKRLQLIAAAMERAPDKSLVEQAGTSAALEATYRFFSNERVSPEQVPGGHMSKTAQRASAHSSVLVIHDTTEFRFGGVAERTGLGRISTKKREGFLAHYSICLSAEGEPLGTLGLIAWSRLDVEKRPKSIGTLRNPDRESLRWASAAHVASQRLARKTTPIHVMDREGDQFWLFAELMDDDERFVIRLGHDRRLEKGRGRGCLMLNDVLGKSGLRFTKDVLLGRRQLERATKKQKVFPSRDGRLANFEVRAQGIRLFRAHQHAEHLPEFLDLNFVEAREVNVPAGCTPVIWRLVTTEPIGGDEEVDRIIEIYRKRRVIEEFFKAIKTGCRFESHQLENIKGLLVALSIESAVAWQLLHLRWLSRNHPDESASEVLGAAQCQTVQLLRSKRDAAPRKQLSVDDVIEELSRLGVHLKNNGPPGWMVLKRGLRKLNVLAEGLSLAAHCPSDDAIDVINL